MSRELAALSKHIGNSVEVDGRNCAKVMFGEAYARPLLAKSMQDLAYSFPSSILNSGDDRGEVLQKPLQLISTCAQALVDQSIPARLLNTICWKLKVGNRCSRQRSCHQQCSQ
jgi:hypothetical protein